MKEEPVSKFIKVKCNKCKNEQTIFSKTSTHINCLVCDNLLAESTGGKTDVKGMVLEFLQ